MATEKNLQDAFAGESQANRKYLAFGKKAEAEGFKQVAKLFRAASGAETIHAHAHLRVMNGIKSTAENLQTAIDGESYEFKTMYPAFLQEAEAEKNTPATITFKNAMAVEKVHFALYTQALAAIQSGKDLTPSPIFICQVCGNTVFGMAEDKCSVCGAAKDKFSEVR
jgi:rubrerythrin